MSQSDHPGHPGQLDHLSHPGLPDHLDHLDHLDHPSAIPARTAADEFRPIGMDRVREIIGHPPPFIADKKETHLGEFIIRFIAHSTFFCLATSDDAGQLDTSPKGDPPGSVRVLDPWTLVLPDRPGNKLADTFENLRRNPAVGLVFLVPGLREVVRVNGDAFISDDPQLLEMLSADGKPAVLATVVRVREVFSQCGKAVIRAQLWDGDPHRLADAVLMGGNFYTMHIAENAAKMADSLGDQLGNLTAIAEQQYENGLY
ncbi:MSMEG_1061 family FMN-dependent PPOX-type flavoprotein [Streptomyces sp. NPDC090032]|uniref:MSMEG_1061 family FMN-dependent PPOX-type flavoprotein n=1 Tax=Streptomyces sp. NPDC090032 TaxID=3365925 RepID=UPI00382E0A4A